MLVADVPPPSLLDGDSRAGSLEKFISVNDKGFVKVL
jgi:hypothetical protein